MKTFRNEFLSLPRNRYLKSTYLRSIVSRIVGLKGSICYVLFFFSEEPFLLKQTFQYLGYYQIEGNLCGETRQLSVSIPSLSRDFRLVSDRRYFFSLVSLFFIRSWSLRHHLYVCRSKH